MSELLKRLWPLCFGLGALITRPLVAVAAAIVFVLPQNRWRKRGLAVTPTKFGIAFTKLTYNQGGALVHIYTDGTVRMEEEHLDCTHHCNTSFSSNTHQWQPHRVAAP